MKKALSIILAALMLALLAVPALPALAATDYLFSYTYSDIQVEKNSEDQRYHWVDKNGIDRYESNIITSPKAGWGQQDLPCNDASHGISRANTIYLAKNEREGFQVYFYEKGAGRNLRLEVGEFTNADGDVLPHEVFREEYFSPDGVWFEEGVDLVLADALVPCGDVTEIQTAQNQNNAFYIEVRSAADQPAGVYYADVKLYDGDTALTPTFNTTRVAAVVWDFALPQQHYGTMMVGLYNTASNYGACSRFLTANGLDVYGWGTADPCGDVKNPEDRDKLNAIVEGWQEFLLDHGFNVTKVYADSVPGIDRESFETLKTEHPDLLIYPTVHVDMRFANTANSAADEEGCRVLAIGQKAAYFENTNNFVNVVEGGGMNGYEAITRTCELMRDAYINKKDMRGLVQIKGLGCEVCVR